MLSVGQSPVLFAGKPSKAEHSAPKRPDPFAGVPTIKLDDTAPSPFPKPVALKRAGTFEQHGKPITDPAKQNQLLTTLVTELTGKTLSPQSLDHFQNQAAMATPAKPEPKPAGLFHSLREQIEKAARLITTTK